MANDHNFKVKNGLTVEAGNIQAGHDGTYGESGTGRYVTVGFGGISNGSNRVFAHNTGADGLFLASASGRHIYFRTNGGGSNTFTMTSGGDFQVGGTTVITSARNLTNINDITASKITIDDRLIIDGAAFYDNSSNGNNKGFRIGGAGFVPTNGSGTQTNNIVDIGTNAYRFKDLYLSGNITSSGDINLNGKLSIEHDGSNTGDVLSLFDNRFNATTMYGFGLASGTLYYKANTRHQFYSGANYDNSSYDVQFDGQNFIIRTGDLKMGSNTFVDSSRNITSGNVVAGNSSTSAIIRAHYNDGSYMTLEGFGLVMNRGSSYIRPSSDGDKTLYIGGADASLDWNAIHFRSTNGLALNGTNFIDASRNLNNIGTISSGAITSSGQIFTTQESATSLKSRFLMGKASGSTANGELYLQYGSSDRVYIGAGSGGAGLTVSGSVSGTTGHFSGKFAVMSTGVHGSYDFYNNGTSYFNGAVIVDDNLTVAGNLTIQGTTTTLNTATLNVEDKNIVLNYGSGDTSGSADGAGITIQDAVNGSTDAAITWNAASDYFNFSHKINAQGDLQAYNIYAQDYHVLNSAANGWHEWATRNNDKVDLNVASITSGVISASGGVHTFNGGSTDYAATFSSTDAYSGIRFQDPDGSGTVYYRGATDHLYLNSSTFSVGGSTLATNYEFQVNGDANITGNLALNGTTVIDSDSFRGREYIRHKNSSSTVMTMNHDTYTMLRNPLGDTRIWLGSTGYSGASSDNNNYYNGSTHFFRSEGSVERARINVHGVDAKSGGFLINGTSVINSSRNIHNVGTISSGAITATKYGFSDTEHYLEFNATSPISGSTVDTSVLSGRQIDLRAYDDIRLRAGTGDKIVMTAQGADRLQIDSNTRILSGGLQIDSTTVIDSSRNLTNINTLELKASNSSNKWIAYTYTDNTYRINYNGSGADEFIIDSDGRVGIGTNSISTGYKLNVSGNLDMNNSHIHYVNQLHFNNGTRFLGSSASTTVLRSGTSTNSNWIAFQSGSDSTIRGYVGGNTDSGHSVGLLDQGGNWAVRHINDQGTIFYSDTGTEQARIGSDLVSGDYGGMVLKSAKNGYVGYSLNDRAVFMHNNSTVTGIYNDVGNEWYAKFHQDGAAELYHNGYRTFMTQSPGAIIDSASGESTSQLQFKTNGTTRGYVYANTSNQIGFLDSGGDWAILHKNDQGTEFRTDGSTVRAAIGADLVGGDYGSMVVKEYKSSWAGYSIDNNWVFMSSGASAAGLYNDTDNKWALYMDRNAATTLYYNGSGKMNTNSAGIAVTGEVNASASLYAHNKKVLSLESNSSSERGPWNPIVSSIRSSGRMLYKDEEFWTGSNNVNIYNNAGGGTVSHTREADTVTLGADAPNGSGMVIRIYYNGGSASPGFGGFYQSIPSEDNHTFVQIFQAKLPSGKSLYIAENNQGNNKQSYFLTSNAGTGKWEWYARVSHCGDSGTFSSGGHIYVSGGSGAFTWYLASCTVYDVTEHPVASKLELLNDRRNLEFKTDSTGAAGLVLKRSDGTFRAQIYGEGSQYGFLASTWGNWDIRKNVAGKLFLNNQTTYFIQPEASDSAKFFRYVQIGDSSSYGTNSGSWGARLNVTDDVHAKIEVGQDANSMLSHWYAHTGQDSIKIGTSSGHDVELQRGGTTRFEITSGGTTAYENMTFSSGRLRRGDHHLGHLEGSYNNVGANSDKTNPIYTIGSNYNPSATSLTGMYGIGYAHPNLWGTSNGKNVGWGMYVVENGTVNFAAGISGTWSKNPFNRNGNTVWDAGNDGTGSGLDADLLDGYNTSTSATANTVVVREGSGHIYGNYILGSYFNASSGNSENPTIGQVWTQSTGDNYLRKSTPAHFISQLGLFTTGNDGSGSGLDADNLDGVTWGSYKSTGHTQINIQASNSHGVRFWNGSDNYKIYMSSNGGSGAGRMAHETSSDYNMYFKMTAGTDRGFVFQNGSSNLFGIDGSGHVRANSVISSNNRQAMACTHWSNSGTSTGAIKITLPGAPSSVHSMPIIEVHTYQYSSIGHVIYRISGHNWSTASNWYNNRVTAEGGPPLTVRLGHDGSNYCIIIGETNTSWSYGHVTVNLLAHPSFYNGNQNFTEGWGASQITSMPSAVTTQTVGKIFHSANDGAGSGLDADTLDGMNASSSVVANTIVARQANGYIYANHVNFNTGVENPSIANFITDNGDGWSRKSSLSHVRTSITGANSQNNLSTSTGSGGDLNTVFNNGKSGFFDVWGGAAGSNNKPPGTTHVQGVQVRHSTTNHYGWQLASQYNQPGKMYTRNTSNGTFYSWYALYTTVNDGSGSGLDADLLDGLNSTSFVRTDATSTITSGNTLNFQTSSGNTRGMIMASESVPHMRLATSGNESIGFYDGGTSGTENVRINGSGGLEVFNDSLYMQSEGSGYIYSKRGSIKWNHTTAASKGGFIDRHGSNSGGLNTDAYPSPIYSIGLDYQPSGTGLSNHYGIGYAHTNASFYSLSGQSGWGAYVSADGDARIQLGGSNGTISCTGNVVAYASDGRLKTNVKPIENALDKVMKIRGVEYDWVENITTEYDFQPTEMHEVGVIAQEVQKVLPEVVREAPFNSLYTQKTGWTKIQKQMEEELGRKVEKAEAKTKYEELPLEERQSMEENYNFLTVDYERIVPLLIEGIKELKQEVDDLKAKLKEK